MRQAGRHFLQIPGPSHVPDRILRAMDRPTMDHRGPAFGELGHRVLKGMQSIFRSSGPVLIFPSSGTGAWEAALVNTIAPGERVAMVETGHFAGLWSRLAGRLGIETEIVDTDWRRGVDPQAVEDLLRRDSGHRLKALCVVHNETSTGATSRIDEVRQAMDACGHPALLMVDTISALACTEFRFDDWRVDVAIAGSQKGLMLPPGLSFNAVSDKAVEVSRRSGSPRSYWSWADMLGPNADGYFPYTPATNLLYGLAEAIDMLHEEGLDNVFERHRRHGEATRRAVQAWGLEVQCREPRHYSPVLTGVRLPDGHDADAFRAVVLRCFDMSLGNGLGRIAGRVFRIGHLGDFNDLMLMAALSGVEMGLELAAVPHRAGGASSAMDYLRRQAGEWDSSGRRSQAVA
jgi:alanine-glyoxylate transaminase/serine-glyoxylate transaminase/serine-pyruvate transaminase